MAAGARHGDDEEAPDLLGQLVELRRGERPQVRRSADPGEDGHPDIVRAGGTPGPVVGGRCADLHDLSASDHRRRGRAPRPYAWPMRFLPGHQPITDLTYG